MNCNFHPIYSRIFLLPALGLAQLVSAQTNEPLLQKANLIYQGAFRVPQAACTSPQYACFAYGGTAITYNSANNSIFIIGHPYGSLSAEISIPKIVNSTNLSDLNTAAVLQPFTDPIEGTRNTVNPSSPTSVGGNKIGGQLVYAGNLIVSAYSYYDASATQSSSHFRRPADLSVSGQVLGPYKVGQDYPGFVSGYMAVIPPEWRGLLGGPALTGNCCLAITSHQSNGPAASVFDPARLGSSDPVPATEVVGYPHEDPLGPGYETQNKLFNGSTKVTGIVFPSGTRSVLFFGRQGIGPFCYGSGTVTKALAGVSTGEGTNVWCYDPGSSDKGTHAYPYTYQVWAYDAADLLEVKKGTKLPYQIQPYATWTFSLPFENPNDNHYLGGVAYDSQHQLIYVSQLSADSKNPVIHVFKVDSTAQVPAPPTQLQVH